MANREIQVFRWDMSVDPRAEIAELFGMNWDVENHVMYHGEDTNNGFDVIVTNSNQQLYIKNICNGEQLSSNAFSVSNTSGLYYLINDDESAVVFGGSQAGMVMGFTKAGDTFIYFASAVSSNSFNGYYGDNISVSYFRSNHSKVIQNNRMVALAPIVLGLESTVIADELYAMIVGDQSTYRNTEYFSLDGEDYMIMPGMDSDGVRPVIHLGKN